MAFGQVSGPPASGRQVQELLALLQEAGHADFRDARGPMGLTQRQAGGRFTAAEATALIDRLLEAQTDPEGGDADPAENVVALRPGATRPSRRPAIPATRPPATRPPAKRLSAADEAVRRFSTDKLVAELRRRGYTVTEP